MQYQFKMEEGECWWGGSAAYGCQAPFDKESDFSHDYRVEAENQTMPMYLSNRGRCIWSEEPFNVVIKDGTFLFESEYPIILEKLSDTLPEAYRAAQEKYFPPTGNPIPETFFKVPQYNTWMQFTYEPTEEGVLRYAKEIIENGFLPGILIIDEGWQKEYGLWEFEPQKFPHPKVMIHKLHSMGFTVMLWIVPSVRADGRNFVSQFYEWFNPEAWDKVFFRNENGKIVLSRWWNGYSASFDMTKPYDRKVLEGQLTRLMEEYGVDGFKFDGGRLAHWTDMEAQNGPVDKSFTPAERNIAWNEFGARYLFHEYKDTFKGGGKRTAQRLQDRAHSWNENGLNTLIPNAILQGLLGHPFICPDMIGGGEWTIRDLGQEIDEELFVRMAQCAAFFPMMQFSWAPWEAVSAENLALIKKAHDLHVELGDTFLQLVEDAYRTGEPILRPLTYNYPHAGYERIKDQFMLGENILAAPVVEKGAKIKKVYLPEGTWKGSDGKIYEGSAVLDLPVTIESAPYFTREK